MSISTDALQHFTELFHQRKSRFQTLDPELAEIYVNFAYGEVVQHSEGIDTRTRLMLHVAALVASGEEEMYKVMLEAALNVGVSATEIKEILYQASAYVGMGRVYGFLKVTNNELMRRDEKLPLPPQSTTTPETRLAEGDKVQRQVLGDAVVDAMPTHPSAGQQPMVDFLKGNCFGDFYTRGGIGLATRELITLSILVSLGGCEPQVRTHVHSNIRLGNSRKLLINAVIQLLPLIGYPRTLNGLRAIEEETAAP